MIIKTIRTALGSFFGRVDNDEFAAAARPHDPVDYLRNELDGTGLKMVWRYGPFRNRLRRLEGPPFDHPATRAAVEAAGTLPS